MHSTNLQSIIDLFSLYGFDNRHARIYTECLDLGESTVLQLSKRTKISRVTVHNIVNSLIKEGFIYEKRYTQKKRTLIVSDAIIWDEFNNRYLNNYERTKNLTKTIHDIIDEIHGGIHDFTDAKVYKGNIGIHTMLKESVEDNSTMYVIGDNISFVNITDKELLIESYQKRFSRGNKTYLIHLGDPDPTWYKELSPYGLEVRVLYPNTSLLGGINIWGNKIALHDLQKESSSSIIISNPIISRMMHYMRKTLWDLSQVYEI